MIRKKWFAMHGLTYQRYIICFMKISSHAKSMCLGGSHAQIASDAEQQMILLEKVMNLTPEQIDLLAPEQRQQVIQVQQAFRNRTV